MIQVLLIEELPILQAGLRMRLSAESDLSVIGEATDCEKALNLMTRHSPDVIVVDIDQPFGESIATASQIRELSQHARVILLTMNDDRDARVRLHKAGASAFVSKSLPVDTLVATIRRVAH